MNTRTIRPLFLFIVAFVIGRADAAPTLEFVGRAAIPDAEIAAYDHVANMVDITAGERIAMLHHGDGAPDDCLMDRVWPDI